MILHKKYIAITNTIFADFSFKKGEAMEYDSSKNAYLVKTMCGAAFIKKEHVEGAAHLSSFPFVGD